ncbi:MAG: hypothetical protein L6R39_006551 [Caloplaca ligustica]|nr:MAG: hypothetical protein L6R39_006551 [Caloplaca ligustica]
MSSRFAILSAIAAGALAAPTVTPPVQSTTDAVQSFLSVSNLDASQAVAISSKFLADRNSYYSALSTDSAWTTAYSVIATAMPSSVMTAAAANPELQLVSLAQQDSDDLPAWFKAMPTPVQDFWRSVGSKDIELYTSEVDAARPLPSSISASLSSLTSKVTASASAASSAASAAVAKGAAPASPATPGHMTVVAAGVAIAAGLIGMAML